MSLSSYFGEGHFDNKKNLLKHNPGLEFPNLEHLCSRKNRGSLVSLRPSFCYDSGAQRYLSPR